MRQTHIRQLRERITHSFRLSPLKTVEIGDYLNFRLRAAGYRGPDLFTPAIIRAMAKASGGLTRRINLIADKAMLAAFAENTHTIKLKHVKAAVRDSEFSHYEPPQPRVRMGFVLTAFGIGAILGIAMLALFQGYQQAPTSIAEPSPTRAPAQVIAPPVEQAPQPTAPVEPAATQPAAAPATPPAAATPPVATLPERVAQQPAATPEKQIKQINKQPVVAQAPAPSGSTDLIQERSRATMRSVSSCSVQITNNS